MEAAPAPAMPHLTFTEAARRIGCHRDSIYIHATALGIVPTLVKRKRCLTYPQFWALRDAVEAQRRGRQRMRAPDGTFTTV